MCATCWHEEVVRESKELKRKREEAEQVLAGRSSSAASASALGGRPMQTPATAQVPAHSARGLRSEGGIVVDDEHVEQVASVRSVVAVPPREQFIYDDFNAPPALPTHRDAAPAAVPPIVVAVARADAAAVAAFNAPFREDALDVQKVSEYAEEIHENLFEDETKFMPRPDYLEWQTDLNKRMRGILLDWLVEVHMRYKFRTETLFLAQNLVDRYLALRLVTRSRLQLVGVTCMLIAAKFEEIDVPKAAEFAYITDDTYTKDAITSMECTILTALNFEVVAPTPAHFLSRLARANDSDATQRALTQYVLELGMMDIKCLRHAPSLLVSAAIILTNELTGKRPAWPDAMAYHGRYEEGALRACAEEMRAQLQAAPRAAMGAVRQKYQAEARCRVADMPAVLNA